MCARRDRGRSALGAVLALLLAGARAEPPAGLAQLLPAGLEDVLRAASDSCDALPLNVLFSTAYVPDVDLVEFRRHEQQVYSLSRGHLHLRDRWPSTIIIYIPGWWNTPSDESTQTVVKALLSRNPSVLVVDTRLVFSKGYVASSAGVRGLARRLYKFMKNLHDDGFPLPAIQLIGFSLGAHVAGVAGKMLQGHLHQKIERIIALDPARPCFSRLSQFRLDREDAEFVQVLHTSAGLLGLEEPLGHLDVYANGVLVQQPECENHRITLECDHAQAWRLFSASVVDERALLGRRCRSWDELNSGYCSGSEEMVGYHYNPVARGLYLYKSSVKKRREPQQRVSRPLDSSAWWLRRQVSTIPG